MSSYLKGRSQSVYVDGFLSAPLSVTSGVPQGSILGPLLYVIFTNELPEILHTHASAGNIFNTGCHLCGTVCCYADDSTLSIFCENPQDLGRAVSDKYKLVSEFMSDNKLKLNGDKTHLMMMASERSWNVLVDEDDVNLNTGNEVISCSKSGNLLGGIISRNLKWADHILHDSNSLVKQLSKRLTAIRRISYMADFKTRKMLTNGLFMSKLAYLMPLWGGCHKFLINTLQVLQNRAARFVTKQNMYSPVQNLLKECGWLSVHQMVFYHTVVLFFKIRKNGTPVVLHKMVTADYAYATVRET